MFQDFLKRYLSHNLEAHNWLLAYFVYAHAIDDIVDHDNDSPEFILKTFRLAIDVFSFPFYVQYSHVLRPLLQSAHDAYRDSVIMEKSPEEWALKVGDIIRSNAVDVVLTTIFITTDIDTRNAAALELRKISYDTHHDQKGLPT